MTGQARLRKLSGDTTPKGSVRREKPDPLHCRACGREVAGRGDVALCGRCAATVQRIETTGSPIRRLINQPLRHERRAKARRSTPS